MKGGWVDFVFMHLIYVHCVMSLSTLLEFVFFKRRLSLEMWLIDTGSVQIDAYYSLLCLLEMLCACIFSIWDVMPSHIWILYHGLVEYSFLIGLKGILKRALFPYEARYISM